MAGLTKKKTRSTGLKPLQKPSAKVSTRVKNFVNDHKKELKALGYVYAASAIPATLPLAASKAVKAYKGAKKRKTVRNKFQNK
jgi:hypothetical protein